MSSEELRTKICQLVLNTENESVLEEALFLLESSSMDGFGMIPGLPGTEEEKRAAVERGMEERRQGKGMTHEEFLKEQNTWKLSGCLKPEEM